MKVFVFKYSYLVYIYYKRMQNIFHYYSLGKISNMNFHNG